MPKVIDNYIHRIGRTGRAGDLGVSISFLVKQEDFKICKNIIRYMVKADQVITRNISEVANEKNDSGKYSWSFEEIYKG